MAEVTNSQNLTRLDPQDPLPTQSEAAAGTCGCLLFILFTMIFIIGTEFPLIRIWRHFPLYTSNITVEGKVTDKQLNNSSYYVSYKYKASWPNGKQQLFNKNDKVSQQTYDGLEFGGRVLIRYATTDPGISKIDNEYRSLNQLISMNNWFHTIIFTISLVIGCFTVIAGWLNWKDAKKLKVQGVLTEAKIFDRWTETETKDDKEITYYYVAYCFDVPLSDSKSKNESRRIIRAEKNEKAYEASASNPILQVRYVPEYPEICRLTINE